MWYTGCLELYPYGSSGYQTVKFGTILLYVPDEHLEDKYAEGPPVDSLVMTFVLDDLWRQIFRSATQRPRSTITQAIRLYNETRRDRVVRETWIKRSWVRFPAGT